MVMMVRPLHRLVPCQENQHRLRQFHHADLPEHVDDLRRRVMGVGADVQQDSDSRSGHKPLILKDFKCSVFVMERISLQVK